MDSKLASHPGGVLLAVGDAKRFVPAQVALKIVRAPRMTRVAGAPPELLGIVLFEGQSVPVVAIGETRRELVVCAWMGEPIALTGGEVVATGLVDTSGAKPVDLAAIYARIQAGGWATRWGG